MIDLLIGAVLVVLALALAVAIIGWIVTGTRGLWAGFLDLADSFGSRDGLFVAGCAGCIAWLVYLGVPFVAVWLGIAGLASAAGLGIGPSMALATGAALLVLLAQGNRALRRRQERQRRSQAEVVSGRDQGLRRYLPELIDAQGGACGICGGPLPHPPSGDTVHVDHIVPVSRGGTNDLNNLQSTHATCNLRKGAG